MCEQCETIKLIARARVLGLIDTDPLELLETIADSIVKTGEPD